MEFQPKRGFDGTQGAVPSRAYGGPPPPPVAAPSKSMQLVSFILRVVAMVLTFIAAIVMGTAKQSKGVDVGNGLLVAIEVKSGKSSALVYFIVINVLAFLYSAIALAISILNRSGARSLDLPLAIADLIMSVLLFSCNSAATALSVIAEKGNSNLLWDKVCNVMDAFCAHITASIVLSFFASLACLVLVLLAIFNFHRRSL